MSSRAKFRPGKIAILTGAALALNPRPAKEAAALAREGFEVVIYGSGVSRPDLERDRALAQRGGFTFESVVAGESPVLPGVSSAAWTRLRSRLGRELARVLGVENRWQIGPVRPELLRVALSSDAAYFICHLESAVWVGSRLVERGLAVGVDMEDWYSEDLVPAARRDRPTRLLRALERKLLMGAWHSTCPSLAMSEVLAQEFGCQAPTVIYNAFPWADRGALDGRLRDRRDRSCPSIHWYSQTLGGGRGLEELLASLPDVTEEAEIHLRGVPASGFEAWLAARTPERWRDRIFLHPLVSNEELLSRIAEHDIGFAGETKEIRSRDLTVTNKILHYLLGGLAVVASDTAGQREVAARASGAVNLYPSGNPSALAGQINLLLGRAEILRGAKTAALKAAQETFSWEKQEPRLIDVVRRALSGGKRRDPAE